MTSTNVWAYPDTVDADQNLVGYEVEATDGRIGKVDETSTDPTRHYLVVDTGFWILGKKRLIPAGVVNAVDHTTHQVHVSMTRDQIKSAPDHDAGSPAGEDPYRAHHGYYSDYVF